MMYAELIRKKCNKCGEEKELSAFASKRGKPNSRCKVCIGEYMKGLYMANRDREMKKRKEWYSKNREAAIASVKRNYYSNHERIRTESACRRRGITVADYFEMLKSQGGKCAICKEDGSGKRLAIDHCHKSGKVRSLLCLNCNTSLGLLKEDVKRILAVAEYAQKYQN